MKNKLFVIIVISCLALTACATNKKNEIEYGSKFDQKNYFKLKQDEVLDVPLQVNTSIVGEYKLEGSIKKNNKEVKKIKESVFVKDSKKPMIKLIQNENKIYEIPFKDAYQLVGNLESIKDEIDGEFTSISVMDMKDYTSNKKDIINNKKKLDSRIFKTNEETNVIANVANVFIGSDINTDKANIYTVNILAVDQNFNTIEKTYKVKVLKEGKNPKKDLIAAGATNGVIADVSKYKINDKRASAIAAMNEAVPEVVEPSPDTSNFQSNIVPSNNVTAQGSPVLQAALNMVGSKMMCDSLVTMALVNGGLISGNANKIFQDNAYLNIGVYQFPSVAQFISESQAVPGDLVFYDNGGYGSSHIAIYAGNGQAVHGGYNGYNVVVSTVNLGSGPRYMRFSSTTWENLYQKLFSVPSNSGTPPSDEGFNNLPDDVTITSYSGTFSVASGDVGTEISLTSPTPIDTPFVNEQLNSWVYGEITYEQLLANIAAKGYTVV